MKFIAGFADNYLDELMGVINRMYSAISVGRALPAAGGLIGCGTGTPVVRGRTAPKVRPLELKQLPLVLCRFNPGVLTLKDEKAVLLDLTPDRVAFLTGLLTQISGPALNIDGTDLNDFAKHLGQQNVSAVNVEARFEPQPVCLRVWFELSAPGVSRRETHILYFSGKC